MIKETKFKPTEIGLIPEDWEVKELGNLFKISAGGDLRKLDFSKTKTDIHIYPIFSNSLNNKGLYGFSKTYQYEPECVTITGRGDVGTAECRKEKFCAIVRLLILKPKNEISCYFVASYINNRLDFSHVGSAVNQLTAPMISEFKISLPKYDEQSAIAKILSDLDSKIDLLQKQNKTLEKIGQAIFKQWFVDFEFPNEDGLPYKSSGGEMIESELGEIPKGWSVGKLRDLIYVQNGYAFKSSDFLSEGKHGIIKIKNISGNIIDIKNTQYTSDKVISKVDKKFKIESGDLLIAMTGAEVAKVGIVEKNDQSLWLNQRVGLFKETVLGGKMYSYVFLLDESKQSILKSNAHGAAQPNISASQIESLPIITPTKKIILNFFEIFNPAFNKIIGNLNEINSLQKTRNTLLPKLMTGKIRVPLEVLK